VVVSKGKRGIVLAGVVLAVFLDLSAGQVQENYFLPDNILRFAESLYREGDYLRAAGEFQRYLYSFDLRPPNAASIHFKIGLCYRLGREFQKSISYFDKAIELDPQILLTWDSYGQIAYSFFLMGEYQQSLSFLAEKWTLVPSGEGRLKMSLLTGANYLYQKQWNAGEAYLSSLESSFRNHNLSQSMMSFVKEGQRLPRKSEALAGFLSAVIPGAGKIYSRRTTDGLVSLFTVGMTAWQAYEGFRRDGLRSVKGWIYGTISAYFYLGNIYGSVVAVRIYNEDLENKLLDKIGVAVHVIFQ
jgi:tetratricopeptide (TPR) repeat protein